MALTKSKKPLRKKKVKEASSVKEATTIKKPVTAETVGEVDFGKMAKEAGLTELQTRFAFYYVFVTGLNGKEAVDLAGYSWGRYDTNEDYDEGKREFYKELLQRQQAKNLLDNPKILAFITKLRKEMDNQLIVDKLWVIQKLKKLAEKAESESIQLRATEKLGETMDMFGSRVIETDEREDPAKIASAAFEKRKAAMKNKPENVVEFQKEGSNE